MAWDEQASLVQRVKGLVTRGHITRNSTKENYARYHGQTIDGRDFNDIEHFQNQGDFFTPEINDKTEIITLNLSGDETKSVILAICPPPDQTFIPEPGCRAVTCPSNVNIRIEYNKDGFVIRGDISHFGDVIMHGDVEIKQNLNVNQNLVVDGDLQVDGNVTVTGTVFASSFVEI